MRWLTLCVQDATLLAQRKLGQTNLTVKPAQVGTSNATKPENLGQFDYAHLRAPLPPNLKSSEIFTQPGQPLPEAYFLMVRTNKGGKGAFQLTVLSLASEGVAMAISVLLECSKLASLGLSMQKKLQKGTTSRVYQ